MSRLIFLKSVRRRKPGISTISTNLVEFVMDLEQFRRYCLAKKAVTEEFPFDTETLVYKVAGKIFTLTSADHFDSINLKCEPERAVELRENYESVIPGYHMNKKHWNTVYTDGSISDKTLYDWIDHSYYLVVGGLPKSAREKAGLT